MIAEFHRNIFQKPGNHPNFRKNALRAKGHSQSSGRVPGYSRSSSRSSKINSRIAKSHSRNGVSRLEQCESHNSRSNSRSDSRNFGNAHERFSFAPAFSERFFKNWGGARTPEFWERLRAAEKWAQKNPETYHATLRSTSLHVTFTKSRSRIFDSRGN